MSGAAKKIETAANIAIIVAALVFTIVAIKHYAGGPGQRLQHISVGQKFSLQNINWQSSKKNVVLGLSTNCHFCSESSGFYRELVRQCKEKSIRTIAVFPEQANAAEAYLKEKGIQVDEVRQAALPEIGISGTPTLLIVGDKGVVQHVWVGKLPDETEKEVLAKAKG